MCDEVKIDGDYCDTIGQLRKALPGTEIIKSRHYKELPNDEACLCAVDLWATLLAAGCQFDHDPGIARFTVKERSQ